MKNLFGNQVVDEGETEEEYKEQPWRIMFKNGTSVVLRDVNDFEIIQESNELQSFIYAVFYDHDENTVGVFEITGIFYFGPIDALVSQS